MTLLIGQRVLAALFPAVLGGEGRGGFFSGEGWSGGIEEHALSRNLDQGSRFRLHVDLGKHLLP